MATSTNAARIALGLPEVTEQESARRIWSRRKPRIADCTIRVDPCYPDCMSEKGRVNVSLDDEHAAKLSRLAERTQIQEGTLARSLLSQALDETEADPRNIVELLDGIPGAYERAREGLGEARAGRTVALDDL